ncbi:hypothetical protein [Bacillus sp. es.034]|uniref:hypothetical protein n=1 Tax=Bacillus sp. es.034 TaxID=1761763 RepID=UPI000BF79E17|nr:hypothetical protein [Bacillus sp. es.034]PFG07159.1 hypothetical protein ATG71_4030 [Bacillus sp. es.034]
MTKIDMNSLNGSPLFKRMMREAEKFMSQKNQELSTEKANLQFHKDTISKMMIGKPENRNRNFIKNVDGVLMRVKSDDFTTVTVEPVKAFEDLSLEERASLKTDNPKQYKMLQHGLYEAKLTEKHIDLMVLEGTKLEEFEIIANNPSKPSLEGLSIQESTEALRNYQTAKEDYEAKMSAYKSDLEAYRSGVMHKNRDETQERVEHIEKELNGDI